MTVRLSLDKDEQAMAELMRWLADDPDTAQIVVTPGAKPGHDGTMSVVDWLDLVLPNAIAAGSLAVAYMTWRDQRTARGNVPGPGSLREGDRKVPIDHLSVKELSALIDQLNDRDSSDNSGSDDGAPGSQ